MTEKLIDPQAAVDFMIAKSKAYAQAEGNKTYMEEYRKTIKAEQMIVAEEMGFKTAALQERQAYSSAKYKEQTTGQKAKPRYDRKKVTVYAQNGCFIATN